MRRIPCGRGFSYHDSKSVVTAKTSYERLERKLPKEQGHSLAVGISWKRRRAGGPLGKLTCMWEDGVHWDTKATSGEVIVRNRNGVSAHKKDPEEDSEARMGPKQSGDDRGGSVAQERRRCQDGWRTYQRRGRDDG